MVVATRRGELVYPKHRFSPEDTLTFVHLEPFSQVWEELGLDLIDLHDVEVLIMAAPKAGKVIPGTHGLRKIRFAPMDWNVGKSGALRICYVYFEAHSKVLLTIVYPKGRKTTITPREKAMINRLIDSIEQEFDR